MRRVTYMYPVTYAARREPKLELKNRNTCLLQETYCVFFHTPDYTLIHAFCPMIIYRVYLRYFNDELYTQFTLNSYWRVFIRKTGTNDTSLDLLALLDNLPPVVSL